MHAADPVLSPLWVLPFAALLLSIGDPAAVRRTLLAPSAIRWCASALALPVLAYFTYVDPHRLSETALDYVSFIILLGCALRGHQRRRGRGRHAPRRRSATRLYLATGAVIANAIGTTGASMLLIRPLIRANKHRARDQPRVRLLHLPGVEHGRILDAARRSAAVPRLPRGGAVHLDLAALAGVADHRRHRPRGLLRLRLVIMARGESVADKTPRSREAGRLRLDGKRNLLYLAGVVACIFVDRPLREIGMLAMALLSYQTTPEHVHDRNEFTPRSDPRGRGPVRRHLRDHDPGAGRARAERRRARRAPSRGSSSGRPGCCRASSTTRQRT